MTVTFKSDFDVQLIGHFGSDELICWAARVSTMGAASFETEESKGLINFLMKNRHGSPFEHGAMTFRVSAPIFVWREFMRHRIGISYNEQSGRYMELAPVFYIPPQERPLVQTGKPGHYEFIQGTENQTSEVVKELTNTYQVAWESYQYLLTQAIAKEVSRMCLPLGIYSTAYVTMNPRSIMHFLSLRTKSPISHFPSYPQWEINQVANKIEDYFAIQYPLTRNAFNDAGRVCP